MKRLCALLLATTCALTACGRDTEQQVAPAPATTAATATGTPSGTPIGTPVGSPSAPAPPARPAPAILSFTGNTLTGTAFDGATLAGRPVVFWFWAPWCTKCQAEGPAVAEVARRYQDRVTVVGVAGLDRSPQKMADFVERTGTAGFAQLDDRTGALYKHFRVTSQSSYLFVTPDGSTESATGPLNESRLSALVDRHLL
jgi:thiol-disulfide isomerase/thioredoxin